MSDIPESGSPEALQYFLSVKGPVAVVSFAGRLTREAEGVLAQCGNELLAKQPKHVILYLRDIGNRIELAALPAFARMQKQIREMPSDLKLCSLHPEVKRLLEDKGLLRLNEITNNL